MQRQEPHTQPPPLIRPRPQYQQDEQYRRNQQYRQQQSQKLQEKPTTSSLSPPSRTTTAPPSPSAEQCTYSSLMRDKCVYEVEAGMENINIDEDWISRNGAFACIWALTYKLGDTVSESVEVPAKHNTRG
ncbi:uncharacterized protein LTHEOB_5071 [Lasiodiplodia theobromae]|uniref:uncharacterized protein n=1 Tax=Lasiodiplodia theobromae TaxID=45133 RepID=UPI0015C3A9EB|nr:uncharacterized protein LTHEOB_5071 [Lasiodiplodia theobromae]KAF4545812.1 hypothetical protein LTHEOB_5071 [Lasiodiplodia theobromae]